jgi:Domain of unknown function (DUF6457)
VSAWLEQAAQRLADKVGEPPGTYALTDAEVDALLDLARVAARESNERTNAPLLCYLVGLAHGRSPETKLAELTRVAGGSGT